MWFQPFENAYSTSKSEKFSKNFLKIISFGLLGSFLVILSYFRPFDPILEQNKFRKAEKIKNFMRNF